MTARRTSLGLVQVYTGDGKGKTTAALGLAFRAMGYGLRVTIVQFLKGEKKPGEVLMAEKLEPQIKFYRFGTGQFIINRTPTVEEIQLAKQGLETARRLMDSGQCDILILDEISHAVNLRLISSEELIAFIEEKPRSVELILTGRNFPDEVLEKADLISNIQSLKHPFNQGIPARRGIEY